MFSFIKGHETETYPGGLMTSLVILSFLTHPKYKFSSVHSSFFSIGIGFFLTVDCENMIGVVDLLLLSLDNEAAGMFSSSEPKKVELSVGISEVQYFVPLLLLLDNESALVVVVHEGSTIEVPLVLVKLVLVLLEDTGLGVMLLLLGFLEK